jgi:AcrR family transcriptional regulator
MNIKHDNATITKIDGRRQRSSQSSDLIAQACIKIINEGNLNPTAKEVAKRAGVGTRTVFRQYEDMEDLHLRIHNIMKENFRNTIQEFQFKKTSLGDRVDELLCRLVSRYEASDNLIRITFIRMNESERVRANFDEFLELISEFVLTNIPEINTLENIDKHNCIFAFSPANWFSLRHCHHFNAQTIKKMLLSLINMELSKIS